MKDTLTKKFCFTLFLLISMIFMSVTIIGQSGAISSNLDGTHWKGSSTFKLTGGESRAEYDYIFDDHKVYLAWIMSSYTSGGLSYDPVTRRMINEPSRLRSTLSGKETGSYALQGTSILIEFDDHKIEAMIGADRMGGTITTRSGNKTTWSAVRISGDIGPTSETADASQVVFGPWGSYAKLHSAIVRSFNNKLETVPWSDSIPAREKQQLKDDIAADRTSFPQEQFVEVNTLIAKELNRFFNKNMFTTEDFRLPRPKSASDSSSGTGNADLDAALAEPQMTISEYIRQVYIPVVRRTLFRSQ
jgi:hypothetical protein